MVAFVGSAGLLAPAIPMIAPTFAGTYGRKLKMHTETSGGVLAMEPRKHTSKHYVLLFCTPRKSLSAAALSSRNQFGASLVPDQFPVRVSLKFERADAGLTFSHPWAAIPLLPQRQGMRSVVTRASSGIPHNFRSISTEKKPRWWWRTLACIPHLMPLHVMSCCAEGAHQFVPFLDRFEVLADPISGAQLPQWFSMVYCLGIYFLVVKRKTLPQFFRFHVIMALLLENAIQIILIVQRWMPYWTSLDAPFWTVVAYGLLFAMFRCIRDSLKGTSPNVLFFSEAASMHLHLT